MQYPGNVESVGGMPAGSTGEIDRDRFFRQGLWRSVNTAVHGRRAPAGAASLRRKQELRRPDRADLREDLGSTGGGDAVRQFLRRRRSQLEPYHRSEEHTSELQSL